MSRPILVLALVLAAAAPARAVNGFVIGLEPVTGWWSAPLAELAPASCGESLCLDPGTLGAFTYPIDGQQRQGVNLHLGWNVLGHAAVEVVLQATGWEVMTRSRGGSGQTGLRLTWFPAEALVAREWLAPGRVWDVGLELGYGYSIAGGPSFGMDGTYSAIGLSAEWYPIPWFSAGLGVRHVSSAWESFILHFNNGTRWDTPGFVAGQTSLFLAFNFHPGAE